ncbi:SDR family NAD(P)-dependent oxidoreductase [Haematobacter massiliensis]|nr:SDR family oxidoreductase [Haematobacter massiliensis]
MKDQQMERGLFDLTGKVALLTGASRGMGRQMAEALARQGATVVISARKQDQLDAAAAEINAAIGETRVYAVAANAGRKEDLERLVEETHRLAGPIDIVIGNAGVNPHYGPIGEIPDDAYNKIMQTNVQSNLWLARLVAPDMAAKGSGSMIFTASVGALKPSPTLGTYGMSKLALIGLVRNLALEYGPQGIRANAICPGVVKTEFARALWDSEAGEERARTQVPLRRFGQPEDFAGVAVFLASDASSYMTGQALTLCGGTNMWS